jgi:hypothetical protein
MGADAARKHRRKAAKAAAENMVRGSLQSAAEAEAAATETMARVQTSGGLRRTAEVVVEDIEESAGEEMARSFQRAAEEWAATEGTWAQRVLVAEATGEDRAKRLPNGLVGETKSGSKLVAGAADEIMARRSSEEIVQAAIVRAASRMGTEAEDGDVWQAAEVVVVEAMQVGSIEAARAEVADAVNAMGWGATEAAIMEVVQTLVDEGGEYILFEAKLKARNPKESTPLNNIR